MSCAEFGLLSLISFIRTVVRDRCRITLVLINSRSLYLVHDRDKILERVIDGREAVFSMTQKRKKSLASSSPPMPSVCIVCATNVNARRKVRRWSFSERNRSVGWRRIGPPSEMSSQPPIHSLWCPPLCLCELSVPGVVGKYSSTCKSVLMHSCTYA